MMESDLETMWNKLSLTEEKSDVADGRGCVGSEADEESRMWMVGKLLTRGTFNKDAMIAAFKSLWRLVNEKNNANLRPNDYHFNEASFWVRIYDLPLGWMKKEMAVIVGSKVGRVLGPDMGSKEGFWGRFIRMRVEKNVTKPLTRIILLEANAGGSHIGGRVKYERLPSFCYDCGKMGHADSECGFNKEGESSEANHKDEGIKQYGGWLGASPLKRKGNRQGFNGDKGELLRIDDNGQKSISDRGMKTKETVEAAAMAGEGRWSNKERRLDLVSPDSVNYENKYQPNSKAKIMYLIAIVSSLKCWRSEQT